MKNRKIDFDKCPERTKDIYAFLIGFSSRNDSLNTTFRFRRNVTGQRLTWDEL